MKVLLINDSLRAAGAQRQFVELAKGIARRTDVQTEIFLFSDTIEYPEIYPTGIKIHCFKRKKAFDKTTFAGLKKVINDFKPDIIHSWHFIPNIYLYPILLGKKIAFINGSIRNAHTPAMFSGKKIALSLLNSRSAAIVSNSRAGLAAYNIGKKGTVIYNGIDLERFSEKKGKIALKEVVGEKNAAIPDLKVIGMVARFDASKDYDTFLATAEVVTKQHKNTVFICLGEGGRLQAFKEKYKDNDRILFPGRIVNVEAYVSHFTIGALLSNPQKHAEGISNSILEYMALGKPVIANHGGGTSEVVKEGVTGKLIKPQSPEELTQAVLELVEDEKKCNELGINGYNTVRADFSFDNMIDNYIRLYKTVVKSV